MSTGNLTTGIVTIGIVGAGNIGGNCARQFVRAGHQVVLSFSRDPDRLAALAGELGPLASVGSPEQAARCDVVVVSVPWGTIDDVIAQVGSFQGRIVIDTTNQFSRSGPVDLGGRTAARHNAERFVGARYTKSFNTLTSAFQAASAGREGDDRVVQWVCGDDAEAKQIVCSLIDGIGYAAVDLGGIDGCAVMEAPRRAGAVYGEEYRPPDAAAVVAAVSARAPIPAPPAY